MSRAYSLVFAAMAGLLPAVLPAQACPGGTEYLVGHHGLRLNTTTVWFLGDSAHATVKGTDDRANLTWDLKVLPNAQVQRVLWRTLPVTEMNTLIVGRDVDAAFSSRLLTLTTKLAGDKPQVRRINVPVGTMPFVEGAPILLEILLQRARQVGGDDVALPIAWIDLNGSQEVAHLRRVKADSAVLTTTHGNVEMSIARDGSFVTAYDFEDNFMMRKRCVGL